MGGEKTDRVAEDPHRRLRVKVNEKNVHVFIGLCGAPRQQSLRAPSSIQT